MGFLLALLVLFLSFGLLFLFDPNYWVLVVIATVFSAGLMCTIVFGHRGFGGRGNTDLLIYVFILGIASAIAIPKYSQYWKEDSSAVERHE